MIKRKNKYNVKVPNVVRGGIAIPLGNNYYFMRGRKHINGGIDIGNNSRTGIEVEDGEVMKMEYGGAKIFSSVPFLNGKSPALRLLQGENPDEVFKDQENFKIRNNINNDGTPKNKKNTAICKMGGTLPDNLVQESDATYVNGISKVNERNRNIPYGAFQINRSPLAIIDAIDDKTNMNKDGHLITGTAPVPSFAKTPLTLKNIRNGIRPLSSLPSNKVYRYTNMREVKDAKNVGYYRKMPNNITLPSKKIGRFEFTRVRGRDHGGKAASKGQPWSGTTSGGIGEEKYIIATPGRRTRWRVGYHGKYTSLQKFNTIPKGKGLFVKFDENGNTSISTKKMQVYKLDKTTKRVKLLKPNQYKIGGQAKWRSSDKIRSRIAKMEGSSMKTNRSFDLEDRDFYNAMPREVRESLSQDALDNLYSYSYNVGAGNFKNRVVPRLLDLKRGKVGADAVAKAMWASKDNKLRGLRLRRDIERAGFINAYNNAKKKNNINTNINATPVDNTYVSKPVIIQQKDNGLNALQQAAYRIKQVRDNYANQYNQYVTSKGMELMQPKKRYNSTFALGGKINTSTGDDSRKKYGFGDEIFSRTKKFAKNMFGFISDNAVVEVTDSKGKKRNISLGQYRNERIARANAPIKNKNRLITRAFAPKFKESEISYNPFTNKYSYDESKEGLITGIAPSAGFRRGTKTVIRAGKTLRDIRAARAAKATAQATNRATKAISTTKTVAATRTATNVKPLTPKEHADAIIKGMSSKRSNYSNINPEYLVPKGMKPKINPIARVNKNATINRAIESGRSYARHAQQAQKLRNEREAGKAAMQAINKFGKAANIVNHPYLSIWQNASDKIVKGAAIGGLGTYGLLTANDLYNRQYGNNKNTKRNVKTETTNRPITYRYNNVKLHKFKAIDGQVFNSKEEAIQHNKNIQTQVPTHQAQVSTRQGRRNVRTNIPSKKDYSNIKFTMQHDANDDAKDRNVLDNIVALNKQKENFRKTLKTNLATVPSLNSGLSTKINDKYVETKKNEAIKNNNQNNRSRFTTNDYIGLGANAIGSLASTIINARMLNRMKYPDAPTQMTAAKLKTNYNINPQLDAIREQSYNFDSSVDSNTGSSQVALARKQRNRLNRLAAKNELYAQKENYQNEMINKDRLNQQGIANQNIEAYNAWKQGKTAFKNNVAEKRSENYIAGLQNLNSGVQDMLSRQEQREHDNNTIKAMLAANPNVKPKLFSYYGLDLYRFGGRKRNK